MKNFSNIASSLSLVGVVILFFLHFSGKNGKGDAVDTAGVSLNSVYYINIDSLNENLEFLARRQEDLEKREIEAEIALKQKGAELEREIMDYQKQVQSGFLTPKQMQSIEQRLGKKQQAIMAERDSVASTLLKEGQEINRLLADKLKKHIEEFSKTNPCDLVLGYTENSNILYANKQMDITQQILMKLNADKEVQ